MSDSDLMDLLPSFTISWSLLKLMSIESMMPSNHLILCCRLLLPSIFLIKAFFPVNQLFTSGSQNIGALASVLPRNIQGWFPLGLTGFISLLSKGLSGILSSTYNLKASILQHLALMVQLSHVYMTAGKTIVLTKWDFVGKVMSLLFQYTKFVIAFLPRSKRLNFFAAVTIHSDFGAQANKICQFPFFPINLFIYNVLLWLVTFLGLKSVFSDVSIATPALFWLQSAWNLFFKFHFQPVCFWMSSEFLVGSIYLNHVYSSILPISLLNGELNPFIFRIITDRKRHLFISFSICSVGFLCLSCCISVFFCV